MNDIMIDVETLSLDPNAHILSIAAVKFDINSGEYGEVYYETILQNHSNGVIDAATVRWWMRQSNDARDEIWAWKDKQPTLDQSLIRLSCLINEEIVIWQRGTMDYTWLESAFKRCELIVPWSHSQWHDQRTATMNLKKNSIPVRHGTAHNALDDCYHQIDTLVKAVSFS